MRVAIGATLVLAAVGVAALAPVTWTVPAGLAAMSRAEAATASKLGNLSSFRAIVADTKTLADKGDLAGAKTRIKDLEVAWDDAEAGLKPRDATKWHQLDDQIDAVLTALRAGSPSQSDCAQSLQALAASLNQFDGV